VPEHADDFATVRSILAGQRRQGASFEAAWAQALAALPALDEQTVAGQEREHTLAALSQTREAWAAAYRREGPAAAIAA